MPIHLILYPTPAIQCKYCEYLTSGLPTLELRRRLKSVLINAALHSIYNVCVLLVLHFDESSIPVTSPEVILEVSLNLPLRLESCFQSTISMMQISFRYLTADGKEGKLAFHFIFFLYSINFIIACKASQSCVWFKS